MTLWARDRGVSQTGQNVYIDYGSGTSDELPMKWVDLEVSAPRPYNVGGSLNRLTGSVSAILSRAQLEDACYIPTYLVTYLLT